MERIIDWREVISTHRTISGISIRSDLVASLLCNAGKNQLYPNKIYKNKITYYVGPNTQKDGIKALFRSMEKGNAFFVFEKLGVDKWKNLGRFRVMSHREEPGKNIAFSLTKS